MANRREIIRNDKKYIWHPFTQMADWVKDDPTAILAIESGDGIYLKDTAGKKYIDGVSSLWTTLHGHRKHAIDLAVRKQLAKIAHTTFLGLTHEPAVQLAKELVELTPKGLSRVFYSDNGSTSVEIALKMSYQYWQFTKKGSKKNTFLSFVNAYHGDTIGSVSVGGMDVFHAAFRPLLFKPYFAPSPYCYRCAHRKHQLRFGASVEDFPDHCRRAGCSGQCLKETEALLKAHKDEIAAAVIEPLVQGAAGMLTMPKGYLRRIEALCRKYGVLLICDEVATGFGRTGRMFAVEHEGVRPDFMCLSKGITGGYLPLAATLATEKVYKAFLGKFEENKTFFHGHTYTANPLACAAALANLEIFRTEPVLRQLVEKTAHLRNELMALSSNPWVGDIRNIGMMTGIELVKDRATGEAFPSKKKVGAKVCAACRPKGLLIRPLGDTIVLMPPLSISHTDLSNVVRTVGEAITEVLGGKKKKKR